jgi:GNAT superfamily N-acetyltransferase
MTIRPLADHPEFIPTLAQWHHTEWAYLRDGDTIEARISRLRSMCGRQEPPITFVALENGELLASAMLLLNDMDTRPELSPWLAGVFTAPGYRGRGIATQLSRHVVCHGEKLVFDGFISTPPAPRSFIVASVGW